MFQLRFKIELKDSYDCKVKFILKIVPSILFGSPISRLIITLEYVIEHIVQVFELLFSFELLHKP